MNISYKWLKDYLKFDLTPEETSAALTSIGLETEGVEEIETIKGGLKGLVVGHVLTCEPHPDSDHMHITTVDLGDAQWVKDAYGQNCEINEQGHVIAQIVCGAPNVDANQKVIVATLGTVLYDGDQTFTIKKAKLRGVNSNGMICAEDEIGVGTDHNGIIVLPAETPVGMLASEYYHVESDYQIAVDITPNRIDAASHYGVARDLNAYLGAHDMKHELIKPSVADFDAALAADHQAQTHIQPIQIKVENAEACPRYSGITIEGVTVKESPEWLKTRLQAIGLRPINNIVDITNYVMLEIGQPLHAFDLRFVKGGRIVVRCAEPGETLMTLDEKERELTDSMLVICNEEGPMAVAGVMGGENSGIMDDTVDVVFEAATFDSTSIRRTSRTLGLRTESSSRFEKGVGVDMAELGLRRALALVCELGCGEVLSDWVDEGTSETEPVKLHITPFQVNRLLGREIPVDTMISILRRLHFEASFDGEYMDITAPSFRRDIVGPADIAEEVQRIHGYDKIAIEPINGRMHRGHLTEVQKDRYQIKDLMAGMGYFETLNYSFMSPAALDRLHLEADSPLRQAVRIRNPLGEDYSLLRTTLVPTLLNNVLTNQNHRASVIRLFEMSKVFIPKAFPLTEQPDERLKLCFGILDPKADFFEGKGVLEALFSALHVEGVRFTAGGPSYYHPGRKALALIGDEVIAEVGEIHPDVADAFGISGRVICAEADVEKIISHMKEDLSIRPLPRYPSVKLDLAVTVDDEIPAGAMLERIALSGDGILETCDVFDVYRGAQVGEGKKSIAFSLEFRAQDHTLTDEEVNGVYDRILADLMSSFGAVRR